MRALRQPSGRVVAEAGVGEVCQVTDKVVDIVPDGTGEAGQRQGDGERALDGAGAGHFADAAAGPALSFAACVIEGGLKGGEAAAEAGRGVTRGPGRLWRRGGADGKDVAGENEDAGELVFRQIVRLRMEIGFLCLSRRGFVHVEAGRTGLAGAFGRGRAR